MSEYPKREKFFSQKFIRILTKSAAAQYLGPNACWMLAVIACQEDAKRYLGPVTYYYEQLMPLCGFRSRKQLRTAIESAEKHGWLKYNPGSKGVPGEFFVAIPITGIDASGCDEFSSESELQTELQTRFSSESELKAELQRDTKRNCKGNTSLPIPIPNPNTGDSSPESVPVKSKKPKNKSTTIAGFKEWYAIYPRKVALGDAERAYPKAIAEIQSMDGKTEAEAIGCLLEWTSQRVPSLQLTEKQYQPHPASWLNAQRYRDEIKTASTGKPPEPQLDPPSPHIREEMRVAAERAKRAERKAQAQ